MGICTEQYRRVVGSYNASSMSLYCMCTNRKNSVGRNCQFNFYPFGALIYYIFVTYFTILSLLLVQGMSSSTDTYSIIPNINFTLSVNVLINFSSNVSLLNCKFLCLIFQTILFSLPSITSKGFRKKFYLKHIRFLGFYKCLSYITSFYLVSLNLILIIISNVSLINPGPISSISGLTVHYQNIQGFINYSSLGSEHPSLNITKVLEFQSHISLTQPDVIVLNETWLKPSIRDSEILPFSDYKVFRLDRSIDTHPPDPLNALKFRRNGGGVLIAVKNSLNLKPALFKSTCHAEFLSITLSLSNRKKICISTCYRVGTLGLGNFHEVKRRLNEITKYKSIVSHFLVGDLNLDGIDWELGYSTNSLYTNFLDTFNDLGLCQLITSPTHYMGNILDVLLTDHPSLVNNVVVHDRNEFIKSDHMFISFEVKLKVKRLRKQRRSIYNFSKANWDALNDDLLRVDWDSGLLHCTDIFNAWSIFKTILTALCDKHIPKIKVKSKGHPPWFDSEIHNLCRKKERYRKAFKESSNPSSEAKYKNCRKEIKKKIKEKMRANFEDDTNPACLSKKFWSYVKSSSNTSRIPDIISSKGIFRSDPADKANLFNDYFCEQFSRPSSYNIDIDYNENDPFKDFRINFRTVRSILKSLNSNKSCGPDGISGKILKKCAFSLAYPLSLLFNLSYNLGEMPLEWKLANVVPVHKKGDKSLVENYRPISLTCLIMKVFEKCVRDELISVCLDRIHSSQHGFLPGKSCTTQLIPFVDNLALSLNNCNRTDVVYFDFAKAFDSVNHDIILHKLKFSFNVDGAMLKFLKAYLQGRKQRVVVDQTMSTDANVVSGVPQGSILGPLLFVLFINDMHSVISPGTNIALYADDTKIWRQIFSDTDSDILNDDIAALQLWASSNLMRFHPKKCKVVSICHKDKLLSVLPFYNFPYFIGDNVLDYCEFENDLGVHIHEKLNWNTQYNDLLSKATQRFNLLRRTCHFVNNKRHKRALYLTMVRSIFEHGNTIWAPTSETIINRFESIQKRAIKWILGEQFYNYTKEYYTQQLMDLDILPLAQKFVYNDMVMFYKIMNNLIPVSLPPYIISRSNTRSCTSGRTLGIDSDLVNQPIKNVFGRSFFPRCISTWNHLPMATKTSDNINVFITSVKAYLWDTITRGFDNSFNSSDLEPD